jgi:peptidoglycan/LPS O-acetylase OafA/YrhL
MMVVFYHFTHHSDYHGMLLQDHHWLKQIGSFGPTGVFIFFVISGFVIPLSMIESDYRLGQFPRFFARRMIRLEPPYIITILLILFVSWYFKNSAGQEWLFSWKQLASHFLYLVQFTGQEWYNPIFWTLAIEFQFYIFLGLTLPLLRHRQLWVRWSYTLGIALSGMALSDFAFLPAYLPVFAMGIALVQYRKGLLNSYQALSGIIVGGVVTMILHPLGFGVAALLAVAFIAFVIIQWRPLMWLGELSYSLYLTHGLVGGNFLYIFQFRSESMTWKISMLLLAVAGSILFARIFYLLVEKPARNWSAKIRKQV